MIGPIIAAYQAGRNDARCGRRRNPTRCCAAFYQLGYRDELRAMRLGRRLAQLELEGVLR